MAARYRHRQHSLQEEHCVYRMDYIQLHCSCFPMGISASLLLILSQARVSAQWARQAR